jgi:hypothetical protein
MEYNNIEKLIIDLSKDPFSPKINFQCAVEYEKLNQTASAVSFYLRCAEFGYETHKTLTYNSLLKISRCFENQKDRQWNVSNYIYHALTVQPERPEAYFMASEFHERSGNWQESYTWACLGLTKQEYDFLPANIGYHGKYCLEFEKAVSGWWIGRKDESKEILNSLLTKDIEPSYREAVENNLRKI